jgi:hypothetical protein
LEKFTVEYSVLGVMILDLLLQLSGCLLEPQLLRLLRLQLVGQGAALLRHSLQTLRQLVDSCFYIDWVKDISDIVTIE